MASCCLRSMSMLHFNWRGNGIWITGENRPKFLQEPHDPIRRGSVDIRSFLYRLQINRVLLILWRSTTLHFKKYAARCQWTLTRWPCICQWHQCNVMCGHFSFGWYTVSWRLKQTHKHVKQIMTDLFKSKLLNSFFACSQQLLLQRFLTGHFVST